jgi:GT2 family glycosyltransferase/SAM-dependent methyltransferase
MGSVQEETAAELPPAATARLIEWTGERCVPWAPDVQVVYEHFHRYLWASELVRGKSVLDLACGEGYGAAILARPAQSVVGVDIDARSIEHARVNYKQPGLLFDVADARDLSAFADGSFDVVIAFEMIEHVAEQERVLSEIRRVLRDDGAVVISTPDREVYAGARRAPNPYHVSELSEQELRAMLSGSFAQIAIWGQRTFSGSTLERRDQGSGYIAQSIFLERGEDEVRTVPSPAPVYLIAVASNSSLPALPARSTLSDTGGPLADSWAYERQLTEMRGELRKQRQEIAQLRLRAARDAHTIASLDASVNDATRRLRRVESSVTWQLFQKMRGRFFALLGGESSRGAAAVQATLRLLGRRLRVLASGAQRSENMIERARRRAGTGPIVLPTSGAPLVSIVIPLYAHGELTRVALESIRDNTAHIPYEVILVDDAADDGTKDLLGQVSGANLVVNETNIGYMRSIERGVAAARGRWLVLCNNDIEVEPGWLAALLECGESAADIGVVSPKFVYPDGSLAEAGAVIWRDATGANYGRRGDPGCCHYEFRREVDYGSAATLLVKRELWDEIGGFDERFLPMYYEDSDFCFEARSRGHRVVYEPTARVVHVEGATAGVDESASHKRSQEVNRPKFVEKWRDLLEAEHLPNDQGHLWKAANLRRMPHVLVADHRVPTWDRDSGGLRMRGIIEALLGHGCHVVLLPDNLSPTQPYTRELQRLGVEVLYRVEMEETLRKIGPSLSLVILSRPLVADRWLPQLRACAPDAVIAYDTVDLHWLREARRATFETDDAPARSGEPTGVAGWRELEVSLIQDTDATIVVSEDERAHVLADVPGADVRVVPNVNELRESVPPRTGRDGVLFVGGFEHPPNVDAVLTLVRDVMPHVWEELGEVPVTIVGADPPAEIAALASPLVEVSGWVRDLDPLLDSAAALIAPLRYGAGMKGKVTQSLAVGLPVVTTQVGAEGLDAVDGEHLLIGVNARELAEQTVRLLRDPALWQRLSSSGQRLVAARCSPELISARVGELLDLATARSAARQADRAQPASLLDA